MIGERIELLGFEGNARRKGRDRGAVQRGRGFRSRRKLSRTGNHIARKDADESFFGIARGRFRKGSDVARDRAG